MNIHLAILYEYYLYSGFKGTSAFFKQTLNELISCTLLSCPLIFMSFMTVTCGRVAIVL